MTVRAKVVDQLLLSSLQAYVASPDTIDTVANSVSREFSRVLAERQHGRRRLEVERTKLLTRIRNLVATLEADGPSSTVRQQLRDREAELARVEQDLSHEPRSLQSKVSVFPSWVARNVGNLADLLHEGPERARTQFRRLGVSFSVSPVLDAPRPFLRAVGSTNLVDLLLAEHFDFPATGRSHPRAEE